MEENKDCRDDEHVSYDETVDDSEEEAIAATIAKAGQDIQPLVSILNDARVKDCKDTEIRQRISSVIEFMKKYPYVTAENFKEGRYNWEQKIKDARCFLLVLQQLHPGKLCRKVSESISSFSPNCQIVFVVLYHSFHVLYHI